MIKPILVQPDRYLALMKIFLFMFCIKHDDFRDPKFVFKND